MAPFALALRIALLSTYTTRILAQAWSAPSATRSALRSTISPIEHDSPPIPTPRLDLFRREAFGNAHGVCGYVDGHQGRYILTFNGVTANIVSVVQAAHSSATTKQIGALLILSRNGSLAVMGWTTKMIADYGTSFPP
jgi:hypothetical protein